MQTTIFDIETSALPESEILPYAPEFTAPANYKDPAKIEAYIAEAQAAWLEKAALSPVTGRVIAVGYQTGKDAVLDIEPDDEKHLLERWWAFVLGNWSTHRYVGFNSKRFDLPFLVRRSWKLGLAVPACIRKGRYWDSAFVDLFEEWQLGNNQDSISLDNLCRFLGLGQKNGNGADFHKLPRAEQEAYLRNDLELTAKAAAIIL